MKVSSVSMRLALVFVIPVLLLLAACGGDTGDGDGDDLVVPGGEALNKVVRAARAEARENDTMVMRYTGMRDKTLELTEQALEEEFGIQVTLVNDPLGFTESTIAVIEENRAGRPGVNILYGSSSAVAPAADQNALKTDIDWGAIFGERWPVVAELDEAQLWDKLKGGCLNWIDVVYGIIYNTNQLQGDDIPKTYAELLEDRFRNRVALTASGVTPSLNIAVWSDEEALEWARKAREHGPVWAEGGSSQIAGMVASGEAVAGVLNLNNAIARAARGDPVDWVFTEDALYFHSSPLCVPANATHPNLAMLVIAYWAAEGVGSEIGEEQGWSRIFPEPLGALGRKAQEQGLNPAQYTNRSHPDEQERERVFRDQIARELGTLQ